MRGIAGKLLGRGEHEVAIVDDEDKVVTYLKMLGPRLYLHRAKRETEIGGIVLHETAETCHSFFCVLAIGTGCKQARRDGIEVGSVIKIPANDRFVTHSPYSDDELIVHDSVAELDVTRARK